jgi:hypothetical protein
MRVAAIQSNYVPWKGYFDIINDADIFVFYDEVQYTKNSWRNRNKIYTPNGLQWLTIPIPAKSVKLKISEVVFENNEWMKLHHKTLSLGYANAPHFEQLKKIIDQLYLGQPWTRLADVNRFFTKLVCEILSIKTKIVDSKDFQLTDGRIERLLELLIHLKATNYISGPSGKDYLDEHADRFLAHGIQLEYKDYEGYPAYPQMTEPYESQVSILDMFANLPLDQIPQYIWKGRK